MEKLRFAGYRVVEFASVSKDALSEIAERLIPFREQIIDTWVAHQWSAWQPPGLSSDDLRSVFSGMFGGMLDSMAAREPAVCLLNLEDTGRELAARRFPFEALVISVHFLEESYMPLLLGESPRKSHEWFVAMDEFVHGVLAALATSYFEAYRRELLQEVEVGRVVQEGLLADIPRRVADLDVAHIYTSAHEKAKLGGDFLDSFTLEDGRAVLTVGDLSGHGLEAAADSLTLRSLFRGFMRESADLPEAMQRVSRMVSADLRPDQFATMLAAVYSSGGRLSVASAGHPFPALCNGACRLLDFGGLALGVDAGVGYAVSEVELPSGGVFVAYTDGLIEARSGRDQFGERRLLAAVESMQHGTARAIADHLVDQSLRHAGGRFTDDVAVLVLKRRLA